MPDRPVAASKAIAGKIDTLRQKHTQGVGLTLDKHLAQYYEEDPRDDYYEAKKHVTGTAGHEGLGNTVPVTDRDIQYLLDQRTKEEKYRYDDWKLSTYQPGSDPVRTKFYEKVDPGYFQDREGEIENDLGIIEKLALISLNAPQNEDDLVLLYGISNGRIPVPDWRKHFPDMVVPAPLAQLGVAAYLTQGYFNPKRYVEQYTPARPAPLYTPTPLNLNARKAPPVPNSFSDFMEATSVKRAGGR